MSRLSYIATSLGLFIALGAAAAPDDGSFTIRISGPDGGTAAAAQSAPAQTAQPQQAARPAAQSRTQTQTARPARLAAQTAAQPRTQAQSAQTAQADAAAQAQNAQDNALVSVSEEPERTYQVQPQDTLWSISHRMLPLDGSVNEFQASASIYRRNPDAFANGDVNALRRVTLNIPGTATMARESTETGAELLRRGSMQLPPLSDTPSIQSQIAQAQSSPDESTEILSVPPRRFTAQETLVREISRESNRDVEEQLMPVEPENLSNADGQAQTARATEQNPAPQPVPAPARTQSSAESELIAASSLDFQVVRDLIENTNQRIAKQSDEVDKKISSSLLRTEKIAQSAASDTAKTEVANVMSRYESIIADLQQSNAELRANLSRMGKQIDQVRAISSDNADALAVMQERMSVAGMTDAEGQSIVPQGPMMWILLGIGLMSLILVATLFFFKKKSRHDSAANFEDDYMPNNMGSAELISSSVSLTDEQRAELKEKEEEEAAQKAMEEAEAKLAEERKAQEEQGTDGKRLDADEITIPESMFEGDEELAKKAQQLKESEESKKKPNLEKEEQEAPDNKPQDPTEPPAEIMQAWDEAAQENSGDKDTLDAWVQALEASEQEQTPPKAVSPSSLAKEDEAVVSEEITEGWDESPAPAQENAPQAHEQSSPQEQQVVLNPFANPNLNAQGAAGAPQGIDPKLMAQMAQMAALFGMMDGQNGQSAQFSPEQLAQMAAILQQSAQGQAPQPQPAPQQPEAQAPAQPQEPESQELKDEVQSTAVQDAPQDKHPEAEIAGQWEEALNAPEGQEPALWETGELNEGDELTADEKLARDWAAAMASKQGQEVKEQEVDPNLDWDQALMEQGDSPKDEAPAQTSPDAGAGGNEGEENLAETEDLAPDALLDDALMQEQESTAESLDESLMEPALEDESEGEIPQSAQVQADDWPQLDEEGEENFASGDQEAQFEQEQSSEDELPAEEEQGYAPEDDDEPNAQEGLAEPVQEDYDAQFEAPAEEEEVYAQDEEGGQYEPQPQDLEETYEGEPQVQDDLHYIDPNTQLEGGLTAGELAAMARDSEEVPEEYAGEEPQEQLEEGYALTENEQAEPYEQTEEYPQDLEEAFAQDDAEIDPDPDLPPLDESYIQEMAEAYAQDPHDVEITYEQEPQEHSAEITDDLNAAQEQSEPYLAGTEEQGAYPEEPAQDFEDHGQGEESFSLGLKEPAAELTEEPEPGLIDPDAELEGGITAAELAAMAAEPEEAAVEESLEAEPVPEEAWEPEPQAVQEQIAPEEEEIEPDKAESQAASQEQSADLALTENYQEAPAVSRSPDAEVLGTPLSEELHKGPVISGGYNVDDLAAMMDDGSQKRPLIDHSGSFETADGFGADDLAGMMADPNEYDPKAVQDLAEQLQQEMTEDDWSDFNPEQLKAAAEGRAEDGIEELSSADLEEESAPPHHDLKAEIETAGYDAQQEVMQAEDSLTPDINEVLGEAERLKAQEQELKADPAVTRDVPEGASNKNEDLGLASMLSDADKPVASDFDKLRAQGEPGLEGRDEMVSAQNAQGPSGSMPEGADAVLSQVASAALSESGPIGRSSQAYSQEQSFSPLSEEEKQRFNDNLNLALLYFETGDVDDAMELINEIKHCADHDLALKAYEMAARYGL